MFSKAKQFLADAIAADPVLSQITLVDAVTTDYDNVVRSALRDDGLVIVIVPIQGERGPSKAAVEMEHEIMVTILENTLANSSGNSAFDVAEALFVAVDNHALEMKARKLNFKSGSPAYELGTTDANPVSVFCNFKYRTISTS